MTSRTFAAIAATAVICASSLAFAQMMPAKIADTAKGKALVDGKGMTLYTFQPDAGGASTCNGGCATTWPPLLAEGTPTVGDGLDDGLFATADRDDGKAQVKITCE